MIFLKKVINSVVKTSPPKGDNPLPPCRHPLQERAAYHPNAQPAVHRLPLTPPAATTLGKGKEKNNSNLARF